MTICVIPTCRTADDAEAGAYTCERCRMHLVRQLADIEDYLAIVTAVPGRSGDRGPIGRQFESRPPLWLDVVAMLDWRTELNGPGADDVLDEIPNVWADLDGWSRIVQEEHPDQPRGDGPWFLRTRCDWICRQPWCDEFAGDVARVHGALRRACGDAPARAFAHCPQVVDGSVCDGPLVMFEDGGGAQCRTCRASWRRDQLLDLMMRIAEVTDGGRAAS
jgi:hypothetical protein